MIYKIYSSSSFHAKDEQRMEDESVRVWSARFSE